MDLTDDLKEASESEVIAWFDARPEYKEMLLEDMCAKLGVYYDEEFDDVFSHTNFYLHPKVGLIPRYSLEVFGVSAFEIGAEPYDFYRIIWKSLWFCAIEKTDHGRSSLFFEPLEDFERIKFESEVELQTHLDDIESYLHQWETLEFSNGKQFVPLSELVEIDIDELYESEDVVEWVSPFRLSEFGHSANVLEDENGRIFVHINADGHFLMEVASNEEAEKILNEIWG